MKTILVVDDSELVNQLLFDGLTAAGFTVVQTHDANTAYHYIQRHIPDLILLDVVLPDVNGVQLCQAFRNHPPIKHIPIILLTGTASSTAEKVKGLQAGADDYILKPFEMEELIERVRTVLRRSVATPQESTPSPIPAPVRTPAAAPIASRARMIESEPRSAEKEKPKDRLPVPEVLRRIVLAPATLMSQSIPGVSLMYLVALMILIAGGVTLTPGNSGSPVVACLAAAALWTFGVALVVVSASITGVALHWKDGARVLSLAAVPVLIKLALACVFTAWTTLSPFLFTASPALLFPKMGLWIWRLDAFELWSAWILSILLMHWPGATPRKARGIAVGVWVIVALAAIALSRWRGPS